MSLVRGLITLTLLVLFIWLTLWAWSARRKPMFDAMAQLPLLEDPLDEINENHRPSPRSPS